MTDKETKNYIIDTEKYDTDELESENFTEEKLTLKIKKDVKEVNSYDIENMLGIRLQNCIHECKITRAELSGKTGIAQPTLSLFVNGHRSPSIHNLIKLCKVLGVSADYLLGLDKFITKNDRYNIKKASKLINEANILLNTKYQ